MTIERQGAIYEQFLFDTWGNKNDPAAQEAFRLLRKKYPHIGQPELLSALKESHKNVCAAMAVLDRYEVSYQFSHHFTELMYNAPAIGSAIDGIQYE